MLERVGTIDPELFSMHRESRQITRRHVVLGSEQEVELLLNAIQWHKISDGESNVQIISSNTVSFPCEVIVFATLWSKTYRQLFSMNDITRLKNDRCVLIFELDESPDWKVTIYSKNQNQLCILLSKIFVLV